jgi:hypothetical protein
MGDHGARQYKLTLTQVEPVREHPMQLDNVKGLERERKIVNHVL